MSRLHKRIRDDDVFTFGNDIDKMLAKHSWVITDFVKFCGETTATGEEYARRLFFQEGSWIMFYMSFPANANFVLPDLIGFGDHGVEGIVQLGDPEEWLKQDIFNLEGSNIGATM